MAKTRAIKVLDFAMSAEGEGAETCLQFVESLGLKTLFPVFMGKVRRSLKMRTSSLLA
jgi:beta-catenin-like protein 1